MKTSILFLLFMYACNSTPKKKRVTQVSVIKDVTSFHAIAPDADMILSRFDMKTDPDKAVKFRLLPISDRLLNTTKTIMLGDAKATDKGNTREIVNYRKKIIRWFYQSVRDAVTQFNEATKYDSAPKSECFRIIAGELMWMKKTEATTNTLFIYSDLQENSTLFSTYTKADVTLLEKYADLAIQRLNNSRLLPERLDGFEITVIFCPPTRSADIAFRRMADIYRRVFEPRGATFSIQANN